MPAGVSLLFFSFESVTYSLLTDLIAFWSVSILSSELFALCWCSVSCITAGNSLSPHLAPSFSLCLRRGDGGWCSKQSTHERRFLFCFKNVVGERNSASLSIEGEEKTKKQKRKSVVVVVVPEWCYTTKQQHQNVDLREQNSTLLQHDKLSRFYTRVMACMVRLYINLYVVLISNTVN